MTLPDFYEVTDRYQVVRYHTRIFDRRFVTTPPRLCSRRCGECYTCTHWRVGRHNWVGVPLGLLRYEIDTSEIKFVETHNRSGGSMLTMYRRKLHDRSTPYVKGMYDEQRREHATSAGIDSAEVVLNGGKHYLADRIISLMPEHTHYVEPYFGGGQVLFRKPCEGVSEVVNDLNGELSNFWQVLRSRDWFSQFQRYVEAVPFSEVEFSKAKNCMDDSRILKHLTPVDRATAFFVRYRQSRQGLGKDFATLSRNRTRRGMNEQVSSWLSAVEGLPDAHERLKRVVILNRDALDVIRQQDGPNTLFYLDPPYLHETRTATNAYEFEMTADQHLQLLETLLRIEGKFILSGYRSGLYDGFAWQQRWHRVDIDIDNKASSAKTKQTKTECLWMNFVPETRV